jgi:hypothetical protein
VLLSNSTITSIQRHGRTIFDYSYRTIQDCTSFININIYWKRNRQYSSHMFGRMNIEKATQFFLNHRVIQTARVQLNPQDKNNFLAVRWNHLENIAFHDFKRKYHLELSLEQRWHIFLSIMSTLPFPIDKSLNDFLQSGINDIAMWSVKAKGNYREMEYPETPSAQEIIKEFPFFPLFMYSLNNHEVIYPNNEKAKVIIEHLQELEKLRGREAIWGWYSRAWGLHESQSTK